MLLVVGSILAVLAAAVFVLGAFAAGMSTTGTAPNPGRWAALVLAILAAACFIARHFLHGAAITW